VRLLRGERAGDVVEMSEELTRALEPQGLVERA
jgi:hypothetical protein